MKYIDINKALFSQLKSDYQTHKEGKHYQSQLQSGFDYMEAMIKLFASVNISVIKNINNEIYKTIFIKNFKLTPSLGDFKSLVTIPFSKSIKTKLQNKDELYNFLDSLFIQTKHVTLPTLDALLLNTNETKSIKTPLILMDGYIVGFRNKLKGHGASFRTNDEGQRDLVLNTLENIIIYFEDIYDKIANNLEFYFNKNSTITIIYNEIECELLPIISYIECDKFSCSKKHRTKLFFYNDGKDTKSHYIDYSYNHFHQITQRNEIHESLKKLQEEIVLCTSDMQRQTLLLSNFVGRVEELRVMREHILKAIKNNQTSFTSIIGTPGIGKSALITQLQKALKEDIDTKNQLNSYIFYVQKDTMGVNTEEDKYFYNRLGAYFDKYNVSIKQNLNEIFNLRDNLEKLFEAYEKNPKTKPLLLIIDGLDEFAKPSDILRSIPLTACNKIHIIYSSRPYKKIKDTITAISKENILKNNYSIELGKLLDGEVEELLSRVISKDIQRESQDYKEIVNIIIKQSESLPLYIHYITQELKEENIKNNENIIENIKKWARKLPPKLESFYTDMFKNISLLSRNILQILFFSKSWVSKDDFYTILRSIKKDEFRDIDETDFIEKYFNDIEVFLNIDSQERYGFYHLSVKEHLFEYFKDQNQAFSFNKQRLKEVFIESIIEHYDEYINGMFYLKKGSDIYRLLEDLTEKINYKDTPDYYINNYFHLLNTLIWSNIYIDQLDHEDMRNTRYEKLVETKELTIKNKEDIQNFHTLLKNKKDKQLFEIRYGYEFAFIAEDYSQVLVYKDMYENLVQDLFLDIVLNIDKVEYIEKFIQHKDDWLYALSDGVKNAFIKVIAQQESFDNRFTDVLEFLDDEHKSLLIYKINNIEKAQKIANTICNINLRFKALVSIISKIYDIEKALEITTSDINNDFYLSKALISIISKVNNITLLEKILNLLNNIEDDEYKSDVLAYMASKTDNIVLQDKILNLLDDIEEDEFKSKALAFIVTKTENTTLLEKILNILSDIEENEYKSEALVSIVFKIDDREKALSIIYNINEDEYILKALNAIISRDDIEIALNTTDNIPSDWGKFIFQICMSSRQDTRTLLENLLCVVSKIYDYQYKSEALSFVISRINNIELALKLTYELNYYLYDSEIYNRLTSLEVIVSKLAKINNVEKILKIVNDNIIDNLDKSNLLASIALEIDNTEKALKIIDSIIDTKIKENTLDFKINEVTRVSNITNNIAVSKCKLKTSPLIDFNSINANDIAKSLKVVNDNQFDLNKSKILASIVSKTNNMEKSLKIISYIDDCKYKSEALSLIALKINNVKQALKIANDIPDNFIKSQTLNLIKTRINDKGDVFNLKNSISIDEANLKFFILSAINHKDMLKKIIEITNNFDNRNKIKLLISIISTINDKNILEMILETVDTIYDNWAITEVLNLLDNKIYNKDKLLNIANSISDIEYKSKALSCIDSKVIFVDFDLFHINEDILEFIAFISSKTKNNDILEKSLSIANSISDDSLIFPNRSSALSLIALQMSNVKIALEIANSITDNFIKSKTLTLIISNMDDVKEALENIKYISYTKYKSESLSFIASKTSDEEILTKIILMYPTQIEREKKIYALKDKLLKLQNIQCRQFLNSNIKIIETMEIITELSSNAILKYYNIVFDDNPIELYITKLKKLNNSDKNKKEKSAEFKSIKQEILADEILLQEFIFLYGEELDIEDEDDFEDEFTIRDINKL